MSEFSDMLGEYNDGGGIRKMPRKTARGTYVGDTNGLSYVQVSATQFVVFPPGRLTDDDLLLIERARAAIAAESAVEGKPKRAKDDVPPATG